MFIARLLTLLLLACAGLAVPLAHATPCLLHTPAPVVASPCPHGAMAVADPAQHPAPAPAVVVAACFPHEALAAAAPFELQPPALLPSRPAWPSVIAWPRHAAPPAVSLPPPRLTLAELQRWRL